MEKKLDLFGVLSEGIAIGLKNAFSLIGAIILWLLTIWIPYINVGTTIAICSIPIALSSGKVISPTFIFDAKYRKYMGEYFSLIGLMLIAIIPAYAFMVVPGIIIAIGWSLAVYILLDKGVSPSEAMMQSNKATYGYKWTIFGVGFLLAVAFLILFFIFSKLGSFGFILIILLYLVLLAAELGCMAVIYRKLVRERDLTQIAEEARPDLMEE